MQDGDTGGEAFPCARLHSNLTKRMMLHLHGMSYEAAYQQAALWWSMKLGQSQ